jgi:hypothetical protein
MKKIPRLSSRGRVSLIEMHCVAFHISVKVIRLLLWKFFSCKKYVV